MDHIICFQFTDYVGFRWDSVWFFQSLIPDEEHKILQLPSLVFKSFQCILSKAWYIVSTINEISQLQFFQIKFFWSKSSVGSTVLCNSFARSSRLEPPIYFAWALSLRGPKTLVSWCDSYISPLSHIRLYFKDCSNKGITWFTRSPLDIDIRSLRESLLQLRE